MNILFYKLHKTHVCTDAVTTYYVSWTYPWWWVVWLTCQVICTVSAASSQDRIYKDPEVFWSIQFISLTYSRYHSVIQQIELRNKQRFWRKSKFTQLDQHMTAKCSECYKQDHRFVWCCRHHTRSFTFPIIFFRDLITWKQLWVHPCHTGPPMKHILVPTVAGCSSQLGCCCDKEHSFE